MVQTPNGQPQLNASAWDAAGLRISGQHRGLYARWAATSLHTSVPMMHFWRNVASVFLFEEQLPTIGWLGMWLIIASGISSTMLRTRAVSDSPAEDH